MGNLPSTLVEALKAREVIPFAGAGVSRAVTDEAGRHLFPTWRGLLLAASDRLRAEGLATKANRVQAELEDNEYLGAAEVARDALGAPWFPFLKAPFDPPAEHVRQPGLGGRGARGAGGAVVRLSESAVRSAGRAGAAGESGGGARRLAAGQSAGGDHQLRQGAAVGESTRAGPAALDRERPGESG